MTQHVILGDTDSSYVRLDEYAEHHGIDLDKDTAVILADTLQKKIKDELPDILASKFVTSSDYIKILEPGREIVGRKALLKSKKKRYAIHVVDDEGKTVDKLKIMGMETRRSDTPAFIQDFLTECVTKVVKEDVNYETLRSYVDEFRTIFRNMDPWRRGSPGRVNALKKHTYKYQNWIETSYQTGNKPPQMHITVKAALNTNRLMDFHNEHRWDKIHDGDKVEVIYLTNNPEQMDCVAIKTGEIYVPDWFKELPFDLPRMEEKLIDKKLFNVLGEVLKWDFTPPTNFVDDITRIVDDFYD